MLHINYAYHLFYTILHVSSIIHKNIGTGVNILARQHLYTNNILVQNIF